MGGTPEQIEKHYNLNKVRQRPALELHERAATDMRDPASFFRHLGDDTYYRDYLVLF